MVCSFQIHGVRRLIHAVSIAQIFDYRNYIILERMFNSTDLYHIICPLSWTYRKEGIENEMSQVRKRKCERPDGNRNKFENSSSRLVLVAVHRLVVVAYQMACVHNPGLDRQNFCPEEVQNKNQASLHVCLPELRPPLESINIIRPAPSATEGPGLPPDYVCPLPVALLP